MLETGQDSDDTGVESKKSHSRSFNREGKGALASVNTDRTAKPNEREMTLIQLRSEEGRTVNAITVYPDVADGQDHFQMIAVNAVKMGTFTHWSETRTKEQRKSRHFYKFFPNSVRTQQLFSKFE